MVFFFVSLCVTDGRINGLELTFAEMLRAVDWCYSGRLAEREVRSREVW